ncbi:MAG TPA: hypothetical protein VGQ31_07910 [Candidatus Limnocylindrales bacterium]|nr:hypothetical protein [Candidatus Limnocylindrales bacterium]
MSKIRSGQRLAAFVAGALLLFSVVGALPVAAKAPAWSHRDSQVCSQPGPDQARCTAIARSFFVDGHEVVSRTKAALDVTTAAAQATSFDGTELRTAYGLTAQGDPSLVVAIVDAYDDANAFANVTRFRSDSGLPAIQSCTLATLTSLSSSASAPCFTKTNQTGGTSLPAANAGWATEIDLDLQAVSSVCPMCSILLLESNSASVADLATAVTTAGGTAHVVAISNSYGVTGDYPATSAPAYDNAAKKGIAVTASAGDDGYGASFPASATNVLGVGGTTLAVDASGVRTGETAWSGTGSGCSSYNAAPSWQTIPGNPCAGKKAISDVSADADPNSGLAIYTTYSGTHGYWIFGGTSLSSPIIAALFATRGGYDATTLAGKVAWAAGTPYFDVTSGKNTRRSCSPSVLCTAGVGWDGPTGLGSIAAATAAPVLTSVAVTPASATVQTGGTQQFTATGLDQYGQAVDPQPAFTWTVTGSGNTIGASSGLLTAGATPGTFTVTAAGGGKTGTASVTITSGVSADFSLDASPSSQTIKRGGTATYTVTIGAIGGFSGSVTLSLTGAPGGSTVTFSPNPATGTSTLTVQTRANTPPKSYTLTIGAVSGSLTHTKSVSLTLTK